LADRVAEEDVMLTLVAAVVVHAYAGTPQAAALGALYSDPQKPAIVKRVNIAGKYAGVLTSGGRMEGSLVTAAILVRRFSFGWQALDLLNFRCRLESHHLSDDVEARLMQGMPQPQDDRPCRGLPHDVGPDADVEAVRRLMRGPFVPYVAASGEWAMGGWYGAGGGESLYRKRGGHWNLVESGGGAMGVDYMRKFGVPQSDWCEFGIVDAICR